MKPIPFKDQNVIFGKDQPNYEGLPALRLDTPQGEAISCWRLSFVERIRVLVTGRVWACVLTFNNKLSPFVLSTNKNQFYTKVKEVKNDTN